jgi:hypothetical protein
VTGSRDREWQLPGSGDDEELHADFRSELARTATGDLDARFDLNMPWLWRRGDDSGGYWIAVGLEHWSDIPAPLWRTYLFVSRVNEDGDGPSEYCLDVKLTGRGARDGAVLAATALAAVRADLAERAGTAERFRRPPGAEPRPWRQEGLSSTRVSCSRAGTPSRVSREDGDMPVLLVFTVMLFAGSVAGYLLRPDLKHATPRHWFWAVVSTAALVVMIALTAGAAWAAWLLAAGLLAVLLRRD